MSTTLHFYNGDLSLYYFGVYYKNIMYYISTHPNAEVVMHYLDQGNKNRIIVKSQIPNQHLLVSMKKTLQGTFELINSFVCSFTSQFKFTIAGSPYRVNEPLRVIFNSISSPRNRLPPSNTTILLHRVRPSIRAALRRLGPSTSTSIVVGLVASDQITVRTGIPIIMGANIGTSVTNGVSKVVRALGDEKSTALDSRGGGGAVLKFGKVVGSRVA